MVAAEFEEREYEHPLYAELKVSNGRLWAPGQVLEGYLGVDRTLFLDGPFPLNLHGPFAPPGISLPRYWHFLRDELKVPSKKKLPSFLLNVFLQAKRPRYLTTASTYLVRAGVKGKHWAFSTESEQQLILEKLEAKFVGKMIVSYAAPVFHTDARLHGHTINQTVVKNSTFPSPSLLSGHKDWHYKVPGATGAGASEVRALEEPSLEDRIESLAEPPDHGGRGGRGRGDGPQQPAGGGEDGGWIGNLAALAAGVRGVMADQGLPDSFRRARYLSVVREIADYFDGYPERERAWIVPYLNVAWFLQLYRVSWFCVA